MYSRLSINPWPTTLDCVSWSDDNWIAVACAENFIILTPRLQDANQAGAAWEATPVTANAFTAAEVPQLFPLSFQNFSVGEELSHRYVHALAWSKPRLGRFGRCVLAVLSSNHVLSLWACEGKPNIAANWQRKVVVNVALRAYYGGNVKDSRDQREQRQVNQRIRAFCWSPPAYQDQSLNREDSDFLPLFNDGLQWLAISTIAGDILLLSICPPTPAETAWTVKVLHRFEVRTLVTRKLDPALLDGEVHDVNDALTPQGVFVADHIAWGPWRRSPNAAVDHSVLAFITKGRLFVLQIAFDVLQGSLRMGEPEQEIECRPIMPSKSDLTGPLRFTSGTTHLFCFGRDYVHSIDLAAGLISLKVTSHHLDGRWDEISGMAATRDRHGEQTQVHFASHLLSPGSKTHVLSVPIREDHVQPMAPWKRSLLGLKEEYEMEHDCNNAQIRIWGMAASPLGDSIVTVSTILPADTLVYVIPSDQETVVEVTDIHGSKVHDSLGFGMSLQPPLALSGELLLYSLSERMRNCAERHSAMQLRKSLFGALNVLRHHRYFQENFSLIKETHDIHRALLFLRMKVYLQPHVVEARCEALACIALGDPASAIQWHRQIVRSLVAEICLLSSILQQSRPLDTRILAIYKTINQMLNGDATEDPVTDSLETCSVCSESIAFESVKWATCTNGHRFVRCGLTFLSITTPGISKYCTLCNTEFLDETKLAELQRGEDLDLSADLDVIQQTSMREDGDWVHVSSESDLASCPPMSLAHLLFAAFGSCLYCGGRYVA